MDDDDDSSFRLPFSTCPPDVGGVDTWDAEGFISPYMPTTQEKLSTIISSIEFLPGDVLYDLGCGDGRALFTAVAAGCPKAVGVDMDEALVSYVKEQIKIKGLEGKVEALVQDMLQTDLSEATVLYLYLLPKALEMLQPKIAELLNSGRLRLVVATLFDFPDLRFPRSHNSMTGYYTYTKAAN